MFNLHDNKTADGVKIYPGMFVFTNEVRAGIVLYDRNENMCCHYEHHADGQLSIDRVWFTNHSFTAVVPDCHRCKHDHWFDVQYSDGSTVMMNGERLAMHHLDYNGVTHTAELVYRRETGEVACHDLNVR